MRFNAPVIHGSATAGLAVFVGFTWGPEYAVVVFGGLIWLQSLALIAAVVGDRRAVRVEELRQGRMEELLLADVSSDHEDPPHLRPVP